MLHLTRRALPLAFVATLLLAALAPVSAEEPQRADSVDAEFQESISLSEVGRVEVEATERSVPEETEALTVDLLERLALEPEQAQMTPAKQGFFALGVCQHTCHVCQIDSDCPPIFGPQRCVSQCY